MRRRCTILLLLTPVLLVTGVLFAGGMGAALLESFGYQPALGRTRLTLEAYREVLTGGDFLPSLGVTLWIAGVSTLLSTVLAVLASLALRSGSGRVQTVLFQLPITVPHLVAAVGVALVVSQSGLGARVAAALGLVAEPADFPALLYDQWSVGIILTYVWKEVPFITLVVLAALRGTAAELEEAARTLGAGRWQRLRHIVLPAIAPPVVAASLVVFAFTFGAFEVPFLLGQSYPVALPVAAWNEYRDIDLTSRPVAMTINVLTALITGLIAAVYLRLARGYGRV